MGNLRQSYTDDEWEELMYKIERDRLGGKPNEDFIQLSLWNKDLTELIKLRDILSNFYQGYELLLFDKWIEWKKAKVN
jgi:hypothetical protein